MHLIGRYKIKKQADKKAKVYSSIQDNFSYLKNYFGNGIDLVTSENEIFSRTRIGIVYIDNITDTEMVRKDVLSPLLRFSGDAHKSPEDTLLFIQYSIIPATNTHTTSDMAMVVEKILNGFTALFLEKSKYVLLIGSLKIEIRPVETPENEATVLGSQESFTDNISTNTSLIIKRLQAPGLRFEEYTVGRLSHTKIKLVWVEGIVDPKIIEEARNRIKNIDIDNINGIGTLSELIEDKTWSIFPKYKQTERPDTAVRYLANGRFCILCNNSPFAFIAPSFFWDNFKTMDDYEERYITGSYLRLTRYIAFAICVLVSALYLSFVTYNQAIVPPGLALSIAQGREGVPFPTIVELLVLTFAMTIIREAGLRMPKSVGNFIGTLAAVLIGQAVVTAGYISPSLIIVVAMGTIASFAISSTTILYTARLLNYFFIILAGFFGIYGVITGLLIIFWHLATLKSFTIPYLYPVVPLDKEGIKDVFIRSSLKTLKKKAKTPQK